MRTISIKCGDSFSIWLKLKTGQTFPLNTNMLVYIGGVLIGNLDTGIPLITYESPYYKMNLSSEDTFPMRGYRDVIVVLDGTDGVRQVIIAGILFERLPTDYQTPTTNDGVNMIIELDVSTSPVTGSAELIDALKGDKGDPGYGVLPIDGAPGQVVTKLSYTGQDAGWRTPIQLGETSADSYRGDRGKIAYDHSQTPHAPADAEKNVNADWDSTSGDSQILNKPIIPSIVGLATTTYVDQQDALKVDKVIGKGLSTNDYTLAEKNKLTAIQAGAQVNILEGVQKNGVDLTITSKKVNVIVPTQPSDIGAQPAGNYATGGGTATGNNTGDNSVNSLYSGLVSNVTHTGDVTGSTALTLATVNSNIGTFNNVTINAKGLAIAGSNVSYLTGITSGQVTTALGYTPKPTFTEKTAFNKNFGTTAGTVLEGRTFGTAANSSVGDFIQNQNSSAQSANMWISGALNTNTFFKAYTSNNIANAILSNSAFIDGGSSTDFNTYVYGNNPYGIWTNSAKRFSIDGLGIATFSSTVNSTGFLLNGNNLTSSLTTNYIPKWNGSSFVNSLISDDGTFVNIGETLSGKYGTVLQAGANINSSIASTISNQSSGSSASANLYLNAFGNSWVMRVGSVANNNNAFSILTDRSSPVERFKIETNGVVTISSTTTSSSPATGALIVGGGIGADHVRANNFYGNGSSLTGVQLPIALTTNGTSGAATFENGVMNVPNYAASGGVNQTQTTVNGSTSGTMVCSMPFQTGSYKKVIIYVNSLNGSATYTYPSPFSMIPRASSSLSITAQSTTSITIAGASAIGWCIIEGY